MELPKAIPAAKKYQVCQNASVRNVWAFFSFSFVRNKLRALQNVAQTLRTEAFLHTLSRENGLKLGCAKMVLCVMYAHHGVRKCFCA